jgi:lipoprotein-anchoring transpeptidase ErfK/SrfK
VSLGQQHLWAYDHDKLILETDVTTGRPELPTPPGHYAIFYKTTPYQMISPWPPSSPFWYPSAWVSWVLEFKEGGYFLHDAPWRDWFGPSSNVYDGTHGCINIPAGPMSQLYNWAQLGDPVDVNVT